MQNQGLKYHLGNKVAEILPTTQASPRGCIFYYSVAVSIWKFHGHFKVKHNPNQIVFFPPRSKHDLPSTFPLSELQSPTSNPRQNPQFSLSTEFSEVYLLRSSQVLFPILSIPALILLTGIQLSLASSKPPSTSQPL